MKKIRYFNYVLLTTILLIFSCSKQQLEIQTNTDLQVKIYNSQNPFYEENLGILEACYNFAEFLSHYDPEIDSLSFEDYFRELQNSFDTYFTFNVIYLINDSISEEFDLMKTFFLEFINSEQCFIEKIQEFELDLIENTNIASTTRNIVLYNLSFYALSWQGFKDIIASQIPWEERVDMCIRDRLNEIFSNPISAAIFLVNPGASMLKLLAECAWEASYGKYAVKQFFSKINLKIL